MSMEAASPLTSGTKSSADSAASKPTTKKSFMGSLVEAGATALHRSASFKEDTYLPSHLKPTEFKALQELKRLLLSSHPAPISIWSVPLHLSDDGATTENDEEQRADVVLLKFLRARDFNVSQAHSMLLRCAEWRKKFGADYLVDEELGFKELEGLVAYMHGWDRDGHPVCYNAYGLFKNKDMYDRVFGDSEKLSKFLRWRVQVMERGVRLLQLKPGGINSIIQVTDLKDMPKRELRVASNQILSLSRTTTPSSLPGK